MYKCPFCHNSYNGNYCSTCRRSISETYRSSTDDSTNLLSSMIIMDSFSNSCDSGHDGGGSDCGCDGGGGCGGD